MEIIFIRHTEKEETGEDPGLTPRGVEQAKHLAKHLAKERFDEFYCSDMRRAKQTAEIISKGINLVPVISDALNEFKAEVVRKKSKDLTLEESTKNKKLIAFLKKITQKPSEERRVLIVAHGLTNRIILSHFFKIQAKKLISFRQSEGAINSIYWAEKFKNWRLKFWNEGNHIPSSLHSKFTYLF